MPDSARFSTSWKFSAHISLLIRTPRMALIAHQTVTQVQCPRAVCLILILDPCRSKSCHFHATSPTHAAAVKRALQFSVLLKNGQIWVYQENLGFSKTCCTGEAVIEYGDAKLVVKKYTSDALWDGVTPSCLWCIITILFKFKMRYIFLFTRCLAPEGWNSCDSNNMVRFSMTTEI